MQKPMGERDAEPQEGPFFPTTFCGACVTWSSLIDGQPMSLIAPNFAADSLVNLF